MTLHDKGTKEGDDGKLKAQRERKREKEKEKERGNKKRGIRGEDVV